MGSKLLRFWIIQDIGIKPIEVSQVLFTETLQVIGRKALNHRPYSGQKQ